MARWLSGLLVLCIAFAGLDAASEVQGLAGCDGERAHEAHGEPHELLCEPSQGSEERTPQGEHVAHFCHCGVHAPALAFCFELKVVPTTHVSPTASNALCGTGRTPPPVRPPELG